MVALLLLHLPHPPESSRADLIHELEIIPVALFEIRRFALKRGGDVGMILAYDGRVMPVLFYWLFVGFGFWGCRARTGVLRRVVGLGADQHARDVHVQREFKVYFIGLVVDLEEEVGC